MAAAAVLDFFKVPTLVCPSFGDVGKLQQFQDFKRRKLRQLFDLAQT